MRFPLFFIMATSLFIPLASAATVTLASPSLDLVLNERGTIERAIAHPGEEVIPCNNGAAMFAVITQDGDEKDITSIPLSDLRLEGTDRFSARSADGKRQVNFTLSRGPRHIAWRITAVTGLDTDREGVRFALYGNGPRRWKAVGLDWMTEVRGGGTRAECRWKHLQHQVAPGNLGGMALYTATDDADEDETLMHLWVDEQMAHPRVDGPWTLERARTWMQEWQRKYADRSQFIMEGTSLEELRAAIPYAERLQAKEIYLFTQTWRTDNFWPGRNGHVHVNRTIFPQGETDLRAFSDELAAKGMNLKVHYVSGGIGKTDAVRIGTKPDRRLASWATGLVAKAVDGKANTIVFKPAKPVNLTEGDGKKPGKPVGLPSFCEFNVMRLDDELISFGPIAKGDGDTLVLSRVQRGAFGTIAAAHAAGGNAVGLVLPYNVNFVPDNDSPLLEEMAKEFAGFIERCHLNNTEYDGSEIHKYNGEWGYHKFATLVYQNLTRPVTAHDSTGGAPYCHFEYRFNSTKRLMRGTCDFTHGGWNAPVQLDSSARMATRMLDANFFLSQGHWGGAQGLCRPEPMFAVSAPTLASFGLTDRMIQAVVDWKAVSRLMSKEQHEQLQALFKKPTPGMPQRSKHAIAEVVPTVRKTADGYAIVPVRVLGRSTGETPWQLGQEHGPLGPRQYLKAGERTELVNPERAQIPGFVIRVLWTLAANGATSAAILGDGKAAAQLTATEVFTKGNEDKPRTTQTVTNLAMMPPAKLEVRNRGTSTVTRDGDRLRVTAENTTGKDAWESRELPSWGLALDMTGRRALGLEVEGDGSGATLLVQVRGGGVRDYVVPIDFTGRRWIEIPHGEVAWANPAWAWRMDTKHCNYAKMREVSLGFGYLPPKHSATVTVGRLQALAEIPVTLTNPVLTLGSRRLEMKGTVASGEYLEYQGGSTVTVYDSNWNKQRDLPVRGSGEIPTGPLAVTFDASSKGGKPWLEMQITTEGTPMLVRVNEMNPPRPSQPAENPSP